jgi:hypothetical protein
MARRPALWQVAREHEPEIAALAFVPLFVLVLTVAHDFFDAAPLAPWHDRLPSKAKAIKVGLYFHVCFSEGEDLFSEPPKTGSRSRSSIISEEDHHH